MLVLRQYRFYCAMLRKARYCHGKLTVRLSVLPSVRLPVTLRYRGHMVGILRKLFRSHLPHEVPPTGLHRNLHGFARFPCDRTALVFFLQRLKTSAVVNRLLKRRALPKYNSPPDSDLGSLVVTNHNVINNSLSCSAQWMTYLSYWSASAQLS